MEIYENFLCRKEMASLDVFIGNKCPEAIEHNTEAADKVLNAAWNGPAEHPHFIYGSSRAMFFLQLHFQEYRGICAIP